MLVCLDAVWAEEMLRDRHLSPEGIYRLKLLATGNPVEAERARAEAWLAERRAKFQRGE